MKQQPNILMIMTDQQRFDTLQAVYPGAWGQKESLTPNLDRLARESTVFTNAYTPSPVCAPARAAIKTGVYPPGCGVVTNWVDFKDTKLDFLPAVLQKQGYDTGLVGKLHFTPADGDFGFRFRRLNDAPYSVYADDDKTSDYIRWLREFSFDKKGIDPVSLFDADESAFDSNLEQFIAGSGFRTQEEHDIPWVVRNSQEFLEEKREKPYFLFASFFGPHQPYLPPEPWCSLVKPESVVLPENFEAQMEHNPIFMQVARCGAAARRMRSTFTKQDYQRLIAYNLGQIAMLDAYIGQLLDTVRCSGEWDNTIVVFLSDHGDHLGSYGLFFKGDMYDSCCKVPLFMKVPGVPAQICSKNVNTLDTYATLLELAGDVSFRDNPVLESCSLVNLLHGDSSDWDDETYSIYGENPETALCMLKSGSMKLIRLGCGEGEALYELYDLAADPAETQNRWEDAALAGIRSELRKKLDSWYLRQAKAYPKTLVRHNKAEQVEQE